MLEHYVFLQFCDLTLLIFKLLVVGLAVGNTGEQEQRRLLLQQPLVSLEAPYNSKRQAYDRGDHTHHQKEHG